jgi:hypothetical protein
MNPETKTPQQITTILNNFNNLPPSLKAKRRWVHWRKETIETKEGQPAKPQKRFYQAHFNEGQFASYAKSTDATTWTTFQEALATLDFNVMDGLAYALDEENGEFLYDDDNADVYDNTGNLSLRIKHNISTLKTYTEYSQSKKIHCMGISHDMRPAMKNPIEIYYHSRFVCMTGDLYDPPNHPYHELEERTQEINALYNTYRPQPTINDHNTINPAPQNKPTPNYTTERIIELGMQDPKFAGLFTCDLDWLNNNVTQKPNGGPDWSEVDSALMAKVRFYTGDDYDMTIKVMKSSKLYTYPPGRPKKWERRDYLPKMFDHLTSAGIPNEYYSWPTPDPLNQKITQLQSLRKTTYEEYENEPPTDKPIPTDDEGYALTTYTPPIETTPPKPPLFLRWSDICIEMKKATKWCVEGLIESGSFCLVNGDSYAGKSLAIAPIVKAVLLGQSIGEFQAHKMPVAIVDFENSIRHFGKTLGVLLETPEEREEIQKYLYRYNRIGRQAEGCDMGATPEQKLAIIVDLIENINQEHGTTEGMMIIDTMRGVFGLDSRDEEKAINTMYPLRGIADRYGWTLMALHHNQKHKQQYSGSMAMIGATTHQFGVEKDTTKRETYFNLEESRDGSHESLIFQYEDNIPLSDYFPPEEYPAIQNDKWHRLVYKSTTTQASINAAANQAQQDCIHICKYLQRVTSANKKEIQDEMKDIQSASLNKKSNKINKTRSQNALIWGVENGWLQQDLADKNNAFVYTITKLGATQTTAAGIQKLRF